MDISTEKEQEWKDLYDFAVVQKNNGIPDGELRNALIEKGLDFASAQKIINNVTSIGTPQAIAENNSVRSSGGGNSDMILGAIICIIGIAVTVFSYSATSSGGGSYVVAWGAIIFGAIRFFKGFANSNE